MLMGDYTVADYYREDALVSFVKEKDEDKIIALQ